MEMTMTISDEMVKTAGFRSGMAKAAAESEEQKRRRMELRGKGSAIGANIGTAAGVAATGAGMVGAHKGIGYLKKNFKTIIKNEPKNDRNIVKALIRNRGKALGAVAGLGALGTLSARFSGAGQGADIGGAVGRYKNMKENSKG